MQKRARIIDNKMKRIQINRRGRTDIKDSLSLPLAYIRLAFLWVTIVAMDAFTGFRVELLWPFWLMVRAGYEALHKTQQSVPSLSSPNSAKFSVFFVCVTATSDLICYLFIPVRMLIFIATTYVWINLIWHTHGGFIRTLNTLCNGDKSQSWLIFMLSGLSIAFEISLRVRCDFLVYANRDQAFTSFGFSPVVPRSINAFFAAHCIGYPVVLVTFSIHYYVSEWKSRRRQGEVAAKNEHLYRLLVESLPADYEGPKDYSTPCIDEDLFMLEPTAPPNQQMAITGPIGNGSTSTKKNGYHKSQPSKRGKKNGSSYGGFNSTPPIEKKKKDKSRRDDLDDNYDSDDDYNWRDDSIEERRSSGLSIIRMLWDVATWSCSIISRIFMGTTETTRVERRIERRPKFDEIEEVDDYEEEQSEQYDKKLHNNNGRAASSESINSNMTTTTSTKSRSNTVQSNGRQSQQTTTKRTNGTMTKNSNKGLNEKINGNSSSSSVLHNNLNGHSRIGGGCSSVRDSSHDTNASNEAELRNMQREIDVLRNELNSKRSNEEDMKLQISMLESNETSLSQTISHMRMRIDQMENKCSQLEKHRESDKASAEMNEQKYVALMARKSELEQALIVERKARNEDTGKKMDLAEHQRERERQLEKETDRLRAELKGKEDLNMRMETEISRLRTYREDNDIDALKLELRLQKENVAHMETAMVSENKLKQELFRAFGLSQEKLYRALVMAESYLARLEKREPTPIDRKKELSNSDQSSPQQQQSAGGSPAPSSRAALSINCPTRGSPLSDKLSPIDMTQLNSPHVVPPPDYDMAVKHPKPDSKNSSYRIKLDFQTNSATGEHLLFDAPSNVSSTSNSCAVSSNHDLLVSRHMGKFGAPSNPAKSN